MQASLDPKVRARICGVVLTSPAVGVQPAHPIFTVSVRFKSISADVPPFSTKQDIMWRLIFCLEPYYFRRHVFYIGTCSSCLFSDAKVSIQCGKQGGCDSI